MSYKRAPGRSLEEWMDLVTECRQSGLTDAAWCNEHGISPSCFYNAVTRLRKKACQIPEPVGKASAIVYTMVEMAKANGVNVYHYLTYLLEKLPDDWMSDDELELLAPWNETVKAEIERRANESNQSYVNCQGAPATEM